jgi:predicted neutral ceramidase superfamily lipid hydrolase
MYFIKFNLEKNAHLKSYLTRLEEKESVENHLSSIKRKEVKDLKFYFLKFQINLNIT